MRRLFLLIVALTVSTTLPLAPVNACSVSWPKGKSPKEVRRRSDVRNVVGTYKLEEIQGRTWIDEDGVEMIENARVLGTVTSKAGKKWKTIHRPVPETGIMCVDVLYAEFRQPWRDAKGSFWLKSVQSGNRHTLLDWDGEYLPDPENAETKVD